MMKFKIVKGDTVKVITGKDKGKIGTVLKVLRDEMRVLVSGVNIIKKHTKPTQTSEGGIIAIESPLHISNVSHIDPKSNEITKIAYKIEKDGSKVRVSKKSGQVIAKEGK